MGHLYQTLRVFFKIIVNTFFRDIRIIGRHRVPKEGPVIIVGNHSNQFVDGLMIVSSVNREVSFIVAAKSMKRPIIGHAASSLGGIGVERAQDLAKSGKGKIVLIDKDMLKGSGTTFSKDVQKGETIHVVTIKQDFVVKEIISDDTLKVSPAEDEGEQVNYVLESNFKIVPRVDQSAMYESVWSSLKEGKCIGIFPEGGSHDRTDLLPLKAGVCIMALGAMAKYNCPVKIMACGLNYFKGHEFRSKVLLDFGEPYSIPKELVELYKTNRRDAIAILLREIEMRLRDVTLTAPSYGELSSIYLARSIYKPDDIELSAERELELNRRFADGYRQLKDNPDIKKMMEYLREYNRRLKILGMNDRDVRNLSKRFWKDLFSFLYSFIMFILSSAFALPGLVMTGPLALLLSYLGEKERRKALAASKVKVEGRDVVASYKIVCAVVVFPISSFFFTTLFYLLARFVIFPEKLTYQALVTLAFFILWPIYSLIMVRSVDGVVSHFRTLKAKLVLLLLGGKILEIKKFREQLQSKIREFVDKFGIEIIKDFEQTRVVSRDEISKDRRQSKKLEEVFAVLSEKGI